jgi:hypothetical protein
MILQWACQSTGANRRGKPPDVSSIFRPHDEVDDETCIALPKKQAITLHALPLNSSPA